MRAGGVDGARPGGERGGEDTARELWGPPPLLSGVRYQLGGLESLLAVRDLETRQTAQGQRRQRGRPQTQFRGETEGDTQGQTEGAILRAENGVRDSELPKETARRTRNSEAERERRAVGRSAPRQRRKPWPAETQAPAENASDPSRFCLIWKILLRP